MSQLSFLQMTDASAWKGLTTENHLGAIWKQDPHKVSDLITKIQSANFGNNIDTLLAQFPTLEFDDERDYTWELSSPAVDNITLIEARIDGTAVAGTDEAGKNFTEFELVFPKDWFDDTQVIVGERNEMYPILIVGEGISEGTNTVYTCRLNTGDADLFIPYEELVSGKKFSGEYSPVESKFSEKGHQPRYKGNITMRNAFTHLRMMKRTPGNMTLRKMGTKLMDPRTKKTFTVWQDYESYMFDREFREDINRMLMYGTANRTEQGGYEVAGKSGYKIVQGAGIRQQMEAANTEFYNDFSIEDLTERLLDLSEGKISGDQRKFVLRTGERGAYLFHKALENFSQLYTPNQSMSRIGSGKSPMGGSIGKPMGYGGQFVEYIGPNGIEVTLSIDSMYGDRDRNKIPHPDGGVAESYRFDIMDIGTTDGMPNIQKVGVKGMPIIHKYVAGLRNPFDPAGAVTAIGSAVDAWEEHKMFIGGVIVRDPSKTASFIPNILA
jgi:hypothetical protein